VRDFFSSLKEESNQSAHIVKSFFKFIKSELLLNCICPSNDLARYLPVTSNLIKSLSLDKFKLLNRPKAS
jgi:hypothetical protein